MAKLLLTTDHKWRDLPGNVYLKRLLEERHGHDVELIRLGEEFALAPHYQPDAVIYNNLYDKQSNLYARKLHRCGVKIIILPTEGITFSSQQTELFTHKHAGIEFVDCYLAWNNLMAEAIEDHKALHSDKVLITGCGRFDFYSSKFHELRKTRREFAIEHGFELDNKVVLLATNFANAEFWPNSKPLEDNLIRQRADGIPAFGDPKRLAKSEYDYRQLAFEFIKDISTLDKTVLLIKYHPSERASVYHELIDEINSKGGTAHLIEGEYIWDALNAADIVVQRCSTIAIEAWLLDKCTVELSLADIPEHFLQPNYSGGSLLVKNKEDFRVRIENYDNSTEKVACEKMRKEILPNLIYKQDGNATDRIAKAIDSCLRESPTNKKRVTHHDAKSFLKRVIRVSLGPRGFDFTKNLFQLKLNDYLGRFDKQFSDKDQAYWEDKLSKF